MADQEMIARIALYKRASINLNGILGTKAQGWIDGFEGREPAPVRARDRIYIHEYENAWLQGAKEREQYGALK